MGNLHEIHIPPDADEPTDWAVRREFGMRYDSYREAQLWGRVAEQFLAKQPFVCVNPEEAWIADMQHSVRVDLTEDQKRRWVR